MIVKAMLLYWYLHILFLVSQGLYKVSMEQIFSLFQSPL
jgi:hypothetical protein